MPFFSFNSSHLLGRVREVDTRKVSILVNTNENLRKARVGQLVSLHVANAVDTWLIGMIEKVAKSATTVECTKKDSVESSDEPVLLEDVIHSVRATLVGAVRWDAIQNRAVFSRSLVHVPEIDAKCYVLRDNQLETFMNVLSTEGDREYSLEIGRYTVDGGAAAFLDGNKLFQRHVALLGSTGSGKSWTVATLLERAAKLPSANLIVFDLHGEYRQMSYARHLRIPGPEELGSSSEELLYLPYWLLNAEEMQAMFIDHSEFSAHNQVVAFQDAIIEQKKSTLVKLEKQDVLAAFTLDSPIPFSIDQVFQTLTDLNEEMIEGSRGLKQGHFFGQFSRLLTRLRSKNIDKRYGFLFQSPDSEHHYDTMAIIAAKLMDYHITGAQVKVIDFSEVPSDILPVIVGLVARVIYQVQFWTDRTRRWPLAFICDEAHLYLPNKENQNPVELRAIDIFEKIAKEGRKYGVSLMIVSQRPSDVSETILSQCNNVIAMRLTNSSDQATVKKMMPESLEGLLDILPIMDIGEAIVVGDAVLLPSRIHIDPPSEKPLSATINFWTEWRKQADVPDFEKAVENMRKQGRGDA
jgi:energy-coupling factor transporter ATP-binding protein EcfA2/phosphoglycolate phosphatase-like HAD superfamily hydrolase